MKHNGWRKPTPGLSSAEKHAQAGERLSIPQTQAMVAVKKVSAAIGLKGTDIMLLDTFGAFTKPQDWQEGRRPIIWPSNAFLMQQTGLSLSALKRHTKYLAEIGLIAFRDSPNGKRWGHRDDQGFILEAYGIDLAPLAARTQEFEQLFVRIQEERSLCANIKNKITISRRAIRAKIEEAFVGVLQGPWRELRAAFEVALGKLPKRAEAPERLLDVLDWFNALRDRVEKAFDIGSSKRQDTCPTVTHNNNTKAFKSINLNPKGPENELHIPTTNQLYPVISNSKEKVRANQKSFLSLELEESDKGESNSKSLTPVSLSGENLRRIARFDVDLSVVMASCPGFAQTARDLIDYVRDWNDAHRAAGKIKNMCGISDNAWNKAQQVLGPFVASAAIALIFEKYNGGEIKSAGGYLRGMVEKAMAGELNLDRSFYGRLSDARVMQ